MLGDEGARHDDVEARLASPFRDALARPVDLAALSRAGLLCHQGACLACELPPVPPQDVTFPCFGFVLSPLLNKGADSGTHGRRATTAPGCRNFIEELQGWFINGDSNSSHIGTIWE